MHPLNLCVCNYMYGYDQWYALTDLWSTSTLLASRTVPSMYMYIEVAVLLKITTKLPSSPVSFDRNWKHLSGLCLTDPEFGVPGSIDILLGVDRFSWVVRQGRQQRPPYPPLTTKTCFGWVLSGTRRHNGYQRREVSCLVSILWKTGYGQRESLAPNWLWSTRKFSSLRKFIP